jgi:PAS domain S-box-containing protein
MATAIGKIKLAKFSAKQAATAFFAEAEENHRALVATPTNAVIATDDQNRILFWNIGAEKLFGLNKQAAIGKVLSEVVEFSGQTVWRSGLGETEAGCGEFASTIKTSAGTYVPVAVSLSARRSPSGWFSTYVIRDVSEQQRYESEIARLSGLGLVGQLASAMGHEVRNPLTTVRGFLQLLCRKDCPNQEYYAMMIEEIDRAESIISQYLSLAKNKAPSLSRECLSTVVLGMQHLLEVLALEHGNQLRVDIAAQPLPPIMLDSLEIKQLILNLVRNAIEASPPGGVVAIGLRSEARAAVLTVSDNGSGIPAEIVTKLGTPFLTTKPEGNGLGLAVCYRIADRHEASVKVESKPNVGTTFSIFFPAAE